MISRNNRGPDIQRSMRRQWWIQLTLREAKKKSTSVPTKKPIQQNIRLNSDGK